MKLTLSPITLLAVVAAVVTPALAGDHYADHTNGHSSRTYGEYQERLTSPYPADSTNHYPGGYQPRTYPQYTPSRASSINHAHPSYSGDGSYHRTNALVPGRSYAGTNAMTNQHIANDLNQMLGPEICRFEPNTYKCVEYTRGDANSYLHMKFEQIPDGHSHSHFRQHSSPSFGHSYHQNAHLDHHEKLHPIHHHDSRLNHHHTSSLNHHHESYPSHRHESYPIHHQGTHPAPQHGAHHSHPYGHTVEHNAHDHTGPTKEHLTLKDRINSLKEKLAQWK
ncbi:hypothetical protein IWQ60_005293, partial [Tieghemiomyces parasiticus]